MDFVKRENQNVLDEESYIAYQDSVSKISLSQTLTAASRVFSMLPNSFLLLVFFIKVTYSA